MFCSITSGFPTVRCLALNIALVSSTALDLELLLEIPSLPTGTTSFKPWVEQYSRTRIDRPLSLDITHTKSYRFPSDAIFLQLGLILRDSIGLDSHIVGDRSDTSIPHASPLHHRLACCPPYPDSRRVPLAQSCFLVSPHHRGQTTDQNFLGARARACINI